MTLSPYVEKPLNSKVIKSFVPELRSRKCFLCFGIPIYIYFFFHHTACESTCDTLTSSAANQGDYTVSVAQGGTATPGTTKQLLPPDRVFKRNIYLYIDKIN